MTTAVKMSESELQSAVIECARMLGWRVAHFRAARTEKGYRTPVEADGAGFPDLCMVNEKQRRVVFAELKSARGHLSPAQAIWLQSLRAARVEVYVWQPADWESGAIEARLR